MAWSEIQWGTVGEWVSGGGALAAVGAAFLIQRRDHKRQDLRDDRQRLEQDERDERRRAEQRRREHYLALDRVQESIRIKGTTRSRNASQHEYSVRYDNSGAQPIYVTSLTVRHQGSVTLFESPSRLLLRPHHRDQALVGWQSIGEEVTDGTLAVFADLEDGLGFKYHHDGDGGITAVPD